MVEISAKLPIRSGKQAVASLDDKGHKDFAFDLRPFRVSCGKLRNHFGSAIAFGDKFVMPPIFSSDR